MAVRMEIVRPRGKKRRKRQARANGQGATKRFRSALFQRNVRGRRGTAAELKFHDLDIDDALVTQAGTIAQVSCVTIAQGTTESERIGRKCTITNINWRYDIVMNDTATADTTSEVVRVILFLDKQTNGNGVAASAALILESDDYQSFNKLNEKGRFSILLDRFYDLSCPSGSGQNAADVFGEQIVSDSVYLKCSLPIEYDDSVTTGAIGNVRTNNIGVLLLAKSGNLATFASKMRLRFSDA